MHVSGFAMLIVMIELLIFSLGVGGVFFLLHKFFAPFKKIVDNFINQD